MRNLVGLFCLSLAAAFPATAQSTALADSMGVGALHLCVADVGVSFGNRPRVHGLRVTLNDHGIDRVDGLALALFSTHENRSARVHGIALNILGGAYPKGLWAESWGIPSAPWLESVVGITASPFGVAIEHSGGILVAGLTATAQQSTGIQLAGIGLELGRTAGIQIGGLALMGHTLGGINASSIATLCDGPVWGINVGGGLLTGTSLAGINAGTFVVAKHVRGLTAGAIVMDHDMSVGGITAAAVIGSPPWMTSEVEPANVGGLASAAIVEARNVDGLSIAGYHHVVGRQRGITIGLYNHAGELHGVQLGILNRAGNNSGAFRMLPVVNAHFGR